MRALETLRTQATTLHHMRFFRNEDEEARDPSSGKRVVRDVVRGATAGNASLQREVDAPRATPSHQPPPSLKKTVPHAGAPKPPPPRWRGRGMVMRVHKKSWTRPKMIAFGALALALFLIVVYVFSSVRVRITPKPPTRQISVTLRAHAAPGASLPAEIMRIHRALEDSFSPPGERMVREPAHGTVVIYKAFSSEAQPLVRRTRFK